MPLDLKNESEFIQACANGNKEKVEALLKKDKTLLDTQSSEVRGKLYPEMYAAMNGHEEILEIFYADKYGYKVNIHRTVNEFNVLYCALRGRKWELGSKLIDKGVRGFDVCIEKDMTPGMTSLLIAVNSQQWSLVGKMISRGAKGFDIAPKNKIGKSSLWIATMQGQWSLVDTMIDLGARGFDISPKEGLEAGMTPLWLAAARSQWHLVEKMIELGAKGFDITPKNGPDAGKNILWFAEHHNQKILIAKIQNRNTTEMLISAVKLMNNNQSDKNLTFFQRFTNEIKAIAKAFDLGIIAGSAGAEVIALDTDGVKNKAVDIIVKRCAASIIGFESEAFILRIRTLKSNFEHQKEHMLFSMNLADIQLTFKECRILFEQLVRRLVKSEASEEALLNALQETDSVKAELIIKQKALENKKHDTFKKQCESTYVYYSSLVAGFEKLTHSTKNIFEHLKTAYNAIQILLDNNNDALEALKAQTGNKKADKEAKKANSDLNGNKQRKDNAEKCYQKALSLLGDTDLKQIRWDFQKAQEVASEEIYEALRNVNLEKMQKLLLPLQACEKSAGEKHVQLKACLTEMESIVEALNTQAERYSIQREHTVALEKAANDAARSAIIKQQEAILAEIEADIKRQQSIAEKQIQLKQREEDRKRWLATLQLKKKVRLEQQREARVAREAAEEETVKSKIEEVETRPMRPRQLTLGRQINAQLKQHEAVISTQDYMESFKMMLEHEFSFKETRKELEGYALLGKLAQLLEALRHQQGDMGKLAQEVRNTLYHKPEIMQFSGKGALKIELVVDMVVNLLSRENNSILPEYFVRLALYPRKYEQAFEDYTEKDLVTLIANLDTAQQEGNAGKKLYKIELPTSKACEQNYKAYSEQLNKIKKAHPDCLRTEMMFNAIGYLEGLMGDCAKIARSYKSYEGTLRKDKAVDEIIESGRLFRHNLQQPPKTHHDACNIKTTEEALNSINAVLSLSSTSGDKNNTNVVISRFKL